MRSSPSSVRVIGRSSWPSWHSTSAKAGRSNVLVGPSLSEITAVADLPRTGPRLSRVRRALQRIAHLRVRAQPRPCPTGRLDCASGPSGMYLNMLLEFEHAATPYRIDETVLEIAVYPMADTLITPTARATDAPRSVSRGAVTDTHITLTPATNFP
jgi:hypothetical protein